MTLRRILGFNHIPNVSSSTSAQFSKALGGLPFVIRNGAGNTKTFVFGGPSTPAIYCGSNSGATSAWWIMPSSSMVVGTPIRSILGFRVRFFNIGTPGAGRATPLVIIAASSWNIDTTNRTFAIQLEDLLTPTDDISTLHNTERYIELAFNWAAGTVDRRVDGKPLSTIAIDSSVLSLFNARNIGVFHASGNGALTQFGFSDFYWIDDTQDDSLNDFLGPQKVIPAELSVTSSAGWTPSSGTADSAINTPVNTSTPDTPTVTSPTNSDPMEADLAFGELVEKINGVGVMPALARTGGTFTTANFALVEGANVSPVRSVVPNASVTHSQPVQAFEKAADGGEWTPEKLNVTKLRVFAS